MLLCNACFCHVMAVVSSILCCVVYFVTSNVHYCTCAYIYSAPNWSKAWSVQCCLLYCALKRIYAYSIVGKAEPLGEGLGSV